MRFYAVSYADSTGRAIRAVTPAWQIPASGEAFALVASRSCRGRAVRNTPLHPAPHQRAGDGGTQAKRTWPGRPTRIRQSSRSVAQPHADTLSGATPVLSPTGGPGFALK